MTFPRKCSPALLAVAVSLLLCGAPLAQSTNQPAQNAARPATVKLSVIVLDKKKQPVTGLGREDFQVFEGDEPQTISFFSKEDVPVSYGLLIDSSGSLRQQFPKILEAGKQIIAGGGPADEAFLVRFISSDKINLAHDFTADKAMLQNRIGSFETEAGQTALIDALLYSAAHLAKRKPEEDVTRRRRALILVSDGEERGSRMRREELIQFLRKADIQVFVIGLVSDLENEGLHTQEPAGQGRRTPRRTGERDRRARLHRRLSLRAARRRARTPAPPPFAVRRRLQRDLQAGQRLLL